MLAFVGVFLWLAGCAGCGTSEEPILETKIEGTNVVLLMIDTLRHDHLGTYGYVGDTSPNIDALASDGVVFENWFSTASWTRPGMATIVTGKYPGEVGVYEEKFDRLPEEVDTLAERLQESGYVTIGVNSNPNLNGAFGFEQGFDAHLDAGVVWNWMKKSGFEGGAFSSKKNNLDNAKLVTDRALAAVDEMVMGGTKPYYLELVYIDPHWPYSPPEEHKNAVNEAGAKNPGYDGNIRFADFEIARLLAELKKRGVGDDTLVIITSDHGEGLDDHPGVPDSDQHGTHLYDTNIHVPMILSHPRLKKGTRVSSMSSAINLVPTVLEFVGIDADSSLPGVSVVPLATGAGDVELPEYVYSETDFRVYHKFSIRSDTHKYIRNDDVIAYRTDTSHEKKTLTATEKKQMTRVPRHEFYAVPGGEYPSKNLFKKQVMASRIEAMKAVLGTWEEDVPRIPPVNRDKDDVFTLGDGTIVPAVSDGSDGPVLDEATMERLRALGYMDE
jgi:arylsulfatase A-like enzyme